MKLGFIGYGNMAAAIIGGILQNGLVQPGEIHILDAMQEKNEAAAQKGLQVASSLEQLKNSAELLFICVKPKDFSALMGKIRPVEGQNITYISIAAGVSIATMEATLGSGASVIRAMPNTPVLVGKGTTALCRNANADDEAYGSVSQIFSGSGTVYHLPESAFNEVLNLNGSSPAYIYLFASTLANYAARHGIEAKTALDMVCDTLKGAAEMLQHAGKTPEALIQDVSSPGGTTVAALTAMRENGLVEALEAGCLACVKRAEEMSRE